MRIVFDNIVFSLQKAGGISVVWKELLSRFINNDKDELNFLEYESNDENIFRKEMKVPSHIVIMRHPIAFVVDRYCDVNINIKKPFIFHSSYFRICSNKSAINVTTVHDFTYEYFYKGKRWGAFLHLWQRNRAIRKSDAVVCISESTKRDLMKFLPDVPPKKIHVIYNAASEEYKVVESKMEGLENYLLYVGERGAYKNGKWLAEAIKDTNYKIIFCGKAMSPAEKDYYDETLGFGRYEVHVGLTNAELNQFYNSVKCLVYPSSYEGFGIPIIEAQSAGCPVIAYNSSSIPEVIGDTPLLMKELSKTELLDKISMLDDKELRESVIKKGLENAKRFSWDKMYSQYRELYLSLMGK